MTASFRYPLPSELIAHVTAICGRRGEEWLERLPETVACLEELWSIRVEEPFPGGEFNYVAKAIHTDGESVVLKISPPYERPEIHCEAAYLSVRNGNSTVRLLAEDANRSAILLEHALPGKALFEHFRDDPLACVDPAISVLKALLLPPPAEVVEVQSLDGWFDRFRQYKKADFPREHAARALAIYEELSQQSDRTFYLHGDFHPGNIVTATRETFLAIDPKGLVGHIGYDIGVFVNNLHWWQKKNGDVGQFLDQAVGKFAVGFDLSELDVRRWAYAFMVIGAWWNFTDMPALYENEVAMVDVWGI